MTILEFSLVDRMNINNYNLRPSKFLLSPMVMSCGSWWKGQDPGYRRLKWAFSAGWLGAFLEIRWGAQSRAADPRHREESAEVARASVPWGGVPGASHREETRGRPRTRWRDYVSWLAQRRLGIPPEEHEEESREREVWASLLRLLPARPGVVPKSAPLPDYASPHWNRYLIA